MWESPIYKLNQPVGADNDGNQIYKEIVVDVTRSAPSFSAPQKALKGAINVAIDLADVHKSGNILDFGSGKLRNALYLLKQGYNVCAVEYESLFVGSRQASSNWHSCQRYKKRFSTLIYPHQFETCADQFDLVLLINVITIMPIPAERLLVLQNCHKRLRPGGHLLWYTQRGDADYHQRLVPEYQIGDGHYIGRKTKYKTFYREFTVADIDRLLATAGFELSRPIEATWRNQARLYRRLEKAPLAMVLTAKEISSAGVVDEKIKAPTKVAPKEVTSRPKKKGDPNPDKLKVESLYIRKLQSIPVGARAAAEYQRCVKEMLELLFPKELRGLRLERTVFSGLKRLDIIAFNRSDSGFFHSLTARHKIICPTIVIECKNYGHALNNPEFDQLGSRLGKRLGRFGLLAYRTAAKRKTVFDRCRAIFDNDEKAIVPLGDRDFEALLSLRMKSDAEEIENYLDELLLEVKAG